MSLITQCPACSTFFRVAPDQLRISDGWVRCGQCDEVFDANASVRSDAELAPVAPAQHDVPLPQEPEAQAVDISATAHAELGAQMSQPMPWPQSPSNAVAEEAQAVVVAPEEVAQAPLHSTSPEAAPAPAPDGLPPDPFLDRSPKELSDFSNALAGVDLNLEAHAPAAAPADAGDERRYMQMFAPSQEAQPDPKLSFMQPLKKPSRWRRPWVRACLGLLSVVLVLLLCGQWVLHERDRLAAAYPQMRPELMALAQAVGLELQPLRQIESVVIDSSAFTKVRNEVYKLSFSLRNTSQLALAMPAMELTLTDMQDQVLLRRVLTVKDFAKLPEVLPAGSEQSANLSVAVRSPVPLDKVAGYRLLAFYP